MTAAAADDFALVTETLRVPDGTRPLVIGKQLLGLEAIEAPGDITCYMARHAAAFGETPPPGCHLTIQVGSHCLRHIQSIGHKPIGPQTWYCAPCAIREWHWWDVTEAATPA